MPIEKKQLKQFRKEHHILEMTGPKFKTKNESEARSICSILITRRKCERSKCVQL